LFSVFSVAQNREDVIDKVYASMNVEYPQIYKEQGVVGRVYVKFLVNKLGQIVDPFVLYSSGRKLLDDEALRAIKSISEPIKGSNIQDATFILPVDFNLDNILQYRLEQNLKKSDKLCNMAAKDLKNKNYSDAKAKYKAALNLNPGNVEIINKLGLMYYKLNQNDSICYYWKEKRIDFSGNNSDTLIKKYCTN
jgi:TonB family protein